MTIIDICMNVQVVVLVLDGQQLRLRRQEQVVADLAFRYDYQSTYSQLRNGTGLSISHTSPASLASRNREGRGLVVAANKSDFLETSHRAYAQGVQDQLQLLSPQVQK